MRSSTERVRIPAIVAVLLTAAIGAAGFQHVFAEERRAGKQVEAELAAIAELKVAQIEVWRAERLADVDVMAENPFVRRALAAAGPGEGGRVDPELGPWLTSIAAHLRYRSAVLLDARGVVVAMGGPGQPPGAANLERHVRGVLRSRAPLFTELETDDATGELHLDLAAPVVDPTRPGAPIGFLLLRIAPGDFLLPLLRSWPRPSATAETLLVRVDGTGAVVVKPGASADAPAHPTPAVADAAVQAAGRGTPFTVSYRDGRDVGMIAAGAGIPGTPWSLVARVEARELLAPVRRQARRLAAIVVLLMASAIGAVALWARHRAAREERERLEAALARDAHARHLELLSEHADDSVLLVDETGRIVRANDRVREYYGWSPAELAGRYVRDLRDPGHADAFDGQLARIRAEGRLRFETVHRRRDGSALPVEVSARGFEAAGRWFFQAVVRDQTARLEALRTIAWQAELLQNLHDAVIGLDADHVIRSWNVAAEHTYGVAAADAIGRPLTEVMTSEYVGATFAEVVAAVQRYGRLKFDVRRRLRGGAWVDVEGSVVALRDDAGRLTGYVSINRDVTVRKRAEAALRDSQERLARILESSSEGVWILDRDATTEYVNDRAARLFGATPAEIVGRPFLDFVAAPAAEEAWAAVSAALRGESVRREFAIERDGGQVWINVSWTPFRAADGRVTGAVGLYMDVTELRRAREQLLQAQKMDAVGRLASGVAHDFNNLLVAILSCSEQLLLELPPGDALRAEAAEIRDAGDRAARLVRQLLAFGRKSAHCPVAVDATAAVRGIEAILRRAAGPDVTVTLALEPAAWIARVDPGQLEQVIMNLAVNARDAMPGGGALRIETREVTLERPPPGAEALAPGRYAVLSVADTGCGMSPEVVAKAFEPFFTTKPKGSGTGLGLATVYAIVQEAGGAVAVESAPGRGTIFTVYLPAAEPAPGPGRSEAAAPPAPPAPCGGGRAVLVVDDEAAVRRAARRVLEHHGFRVTEAGGGEEALALLAGGAQADAVLSDVVMPGLSGPELAERLRALRPGLPVVLMSGCSGGARQGDVLSKPFVADDLVAAVDAATRAEPRRGAA